ncbi:hypothetical protein E2320_000787, partial [Naja naja]
MGIEPTQNPFPKKDQGSGGADLSIGNTYHVLYHWCCHHVQGVQLQVSRNLNKMHTLWWNSVPEDVHQIPVHQDLSEDKAERINDNEDELERLALPEGILVSLCLSPPARLKRVDHKFIQVEAGVEVEGKIGPLMLCKCEENCRSLVRDDNEDELERLALPEGILVSLCLSPPARLKRVDHKFIQVEAGVEVEGKIGPLMLCKCKGVQLQVSRNLNKMHTLWWYSVPEDVQQLPVHQDLDNEDDLEMLALPEGILVFLLLFPLARLKRVDHKFIQVEAGVEVEGKIGPLMLCKCKVHPESGAKGKKKRNMKWR